MKQRDEIVVLTDAVLITCIVQRGVADTVVDAATEAGAQGATIFYARGTGVRQKHLGVLGITVNAEKEVIYIVAPADHADHIFIADERDRQNGARRKFHHSRSNTDIVRGRVADQDELLFQRGLPDKPLAQANLIGDVLAARVGVTSHQTKQLAFAHVDRAHRSAQRGTKLLQHGLRKRGKILLAAHGIGDAGHGVGLIQLDAQGRLRCRRFCARAFGGGRPLFHVLFQRGRHPAHFRLIFTRALQGFLYSLGGKVKKRQGQSHARNDNGMGGNVSLIRRRWQKANHFSLDHPHDNQRCDGEEYYARAFAQQQDRHHHHKRKIDHPCRTDRPAHEEDRSDAQDEKDEHAHAGSIHLSALHQESPDQDQEKSPHHHEYFWRAFHCAS